MAWQMLLIGLIAGWAIELVIDVAFWRKRRVCSDAENELQESVILLRSEVDRLRKKCGETGGSDQEDADDESREKQQPDDLKQIWGIGPKIETVLNLRGIETFQQLAETDHLTIEGYLEEAGEQFEMSKFNIVESWNDQAQLAVAGRWDDLQQYQKRLARDRRRRNFRSRLAR